MRLVELLAHLDHQQPIHEGDEAHQLMVHYSNEARQITAELNNAYQSPAAIQSLFGQLTGRDIPASFTLFPPFYTDFGKNIRVGETVFINAGCKFQDQGGITIGDGVLIGHNVVMATINHGLSREKRHWNYVADYHRQQCVDWC